MRLNNNSPMLSVSEGIGHVYLMHKKWIIRFFSP